jgi:hypothetical protein
LQYLSCLTELQMLNLAETQITSAGLTHLCELPNLGNLNLSHTAVDDEGLAIMGRMKEMAYLDLSSTLVTDRGLHHLARLTQLVELNLSDTAVSGNRLGELSKLHDLTDLHFNPSDDAAFAKLAALPRIQKLHLSGPGVTDTTVAYLLRYTKLKSLTLERTSISWLGLSFVLAFGPDDFETDALQNLAEWLDRPLVAAAFDSPLIESPTLTAVFKLAALVSTGGKAEATP